MKNEQLKFEKDQPAENKAELIAEYIKRISKKDSYEAKYDYRGQSGTFAIYGSDQSGSYSSSTVPCLGLLSGKFEDVLNVAVHLSDWTYWSRHSGGCIERVFIHEAASVQTPQ